MREAAQEREENLSLYDHVNVHHRVNGLNLRTYRFLNFLSGGNLSLCDHGRVYHLVDELRNRYFDHFLNHGTLWLCRKRHAGNIVQRLQAWNLHTLLDRLQCGHLPVVYDWNVHRCVIRLSLRILN